MKKMIVCITYILIFCMSCQSQTTTGERASNITNCKECNLLDTQGRKFGLWIENNGYVEVYYKNNLRDGIYKSYSRKSETLYAFGEYSNGIPCGKWYFFDELGHIHFMQDNIKKNLEYSMKKDDGTKVTPKFISFLRKYYPNGLTKEEGLVVYDDTVEIDYYKIGTWKYYDQEGTLKETKEEQWNFI